MWEKVHDMEMILLVRSSFEKEAQFLTAVNYFPKRIS